MNTLPFLRNLILLLTENLLFLQCVSAQTTILDVRASNGIIIAADSLQEVIIPSTGVGVPEKSVRQSVCKIYQFGNIFYATSGSLLSNPKTGFIGDKVIAKAFQKDKDIADNVDRFGNELQDPLKEAIENVKIEYPDYFEQNIFNHEPVQLLIAGIENGVPILMTRGSKVASSLGEPVRIEINKQGCKEPTCQQDHPFYIALGKHDALDRYVEIEYPDDFEQNIFNHEPVQLLIAGIENGVPILMTRGFKVASSLGEPVRIEINKQGCKEPTCQQDHPFYIALGKHDALDRYV